MGGFLRMRAQWMLSWLANRLRWCVAILIVLMAIVSSPWWLPYPEAQMSISERVKDGDTIRLPQDDPGVRSEAAALAGYWLGSDIKVWYYEDIGEYRGRPFLFLFSREVSRGKPMYGQLGPRYGKLYLDTTTLPKKMDWINSDAYGTVRRGIYELQGDILRIALARPGSARPITIGQESSNVEFMTLKRARVESPEYYEKMLLVPGFEWDGPRSNNEHTPKLQAAIALAYIGDSGASPLLRAIKNESVDIDSIRVALYEIGLPVYDDPFAEDILHRDPKSLEKWWLENRQRTAADRAKFRLSICLPPEGQ